jgi:hypothetical protein
VPVETSDNPARATPTGWLRRSLRDQTVDVALAPASRRDVIGMVVVSVLAIASTIAMALLPRAGVSGGGAYVATFAGVSWAAGAPASPVEAASACAAGSIHMTCQPWPSRSKKLREYMNPWSSAPSASVPPAARTAAQTTSTSSRGATAPSGRRGALTDQPVDAVEERPVLGPPSHRPSGPPAGAD